MTVRQKKLASLKYHDALADIKQRIAEALQPADRRWFEQRQRDRTPQECIQCHQQRLGASFRPGSSLCIVCTDYTDK